MNFSDLTEHTKPIKNIKKKIIIVEQNEISIYKITTKNFINITFQNLLGSINFTKFLQGQEQILHA